VFQRQSSDHWTQQIYVPCEEIMADVFSKSKRSDVMSHIRSRANRDTELALKGVFQELGIRGWRRNQSLLGRPDFVFRQQRIAVFVDGCFWHCCPQHQTWPKNNARFWREKLQSNQARDRAVNRALRSQGWRVLRIWEHELTAKHRRSLIVRLRRYFPREE
jgi:DNA mismatch endonuclease, patch repair protein